MTQEKKLNYLRAGDQLTEIASGEPAVALDPFIGTWVNTKKNTTGFVRLVIMNRAGKLRLRAYGATGAEPSDWGETEAFAYSSAVDALDGQAFSAFYDTGAVEVALQGNLNLGLLILVTFNRFKDHSSRANYICREFFHR